MDLDSESTATSIDENTENFCENPTRDTLAEGLMGLIKPTVDQLDERVRATRISQLELKQCIESLSEELKKISECQQTPIDLDIYVKKTDKREAKSNSSIKYPSKCSREIE
ncbi:hypothetical protein NQ314_015865 [Rhamnusium bicolor]|uniref:Biogenesis of lysosome-related organelles complex 1 subunit 7 n=1 Tax=Rhamnusium bicolor TaxID=1586634 RepID=A0AAV8WXS5_9CUCU|nr:hypothetical protein NQ314_015865 [Rhamnusium bicolor]